MTIIEECCRELFRDHIKIVFLFLFLFFCFFCCFVEISEFAFDFSKTKRYLHNWSTRVILYTSIVKIWIFILLILTLFTKFRRVTWRFS